MKKTEPTMRDLRKALHTPSEERTSDQVQAVAAWQATVSPMIEELQGMTGPMAEACDAMVSRWRTVLGNCVPDRLEGLDSLSLVDHLEGTGDLSSVYGVGTLPMPPTPMVSIDHGLDPVQQESYLKEMVQLVSRAILQEIRRGSAEQIHHRQEQQHDEDARPLRTGAPGRPTSMYLVLDRFEERIQNHELESSVGREAGYLAEWFTTTHPNTPPLKARSIENKIRHDYRRARARQRDA